jgi:hypothetical protein
MQLTYPSAQRAVRSRPSLNVVRVDEDGGWRMEGFRKDFCQRFRLVESRLAEVRSVKRRETVFLSKTDSCASVRDETL